MAKRKNKTYLTNAYDNIDFDSIEASEKAAKIMKNKKCLYEIYVEVYKMMMSSAIKYLFLHKDAKMLEIGSGGGFIKDLFPNVITSDIKPLPTVDIVVNAEKLPFGDGELDVIFAVHAIHHIPDINKFLDEVKRTVTVGGGVVCVEPYWSLLACIIYKIMHPEPFDKMASKWTLDSTGPMSGSNQALSYILLKRDKDKFLEKYPEFEIVRIKRFGFIRYFCTGGIWLNQKLPDFCFPFLKVLEKALLPLMPVLAIHHAFIIRKKRTWTK